MSRSRSSPCRAVSPARPTRKRSGICCPAVSTRSGKSPKTDSTSTSSTTRIPTLAGKTYTRFGGFLDGIDGFDPGILRHLAARSRLDRAAAAADARNRLGGSGEGRVLAVIVARQPNRHLRRRGRQRVRASAVRRVDRQDRALLHHRQCAQRDFRSGCLRARIRRAGRRGRHRLQLLAGGRPPGRPGVALR